MVSSPGMCNRVAELSPQTNARGSFLRDLVDFVFVLAMMIGVLRLISCKSLMDAARGVINRNFYPSVFRPADSKTVSWDENVRWTGVSVGSIERCRGLGRLTFIG